MFKLLRFKPARAESADAGTVAFVDRRAEPRTPVFQEATLTLEGYFRIRAAITDISVRGACIAYAVRVDLPSRIFIAAPGVGIDGWARVVWQRDGVAGVEFVKP